LIVKATQLDVNLKSAPQEKLRIRQSSGGFQRLSPDLI
jgi:hypothetical protein